MWAGILSIVNGTCFLLFLLIQNVVAQEPPPPPPPPAAPRPDLHSRLTDLNRKLQSEKAVDVSAQRALQYSRRYLRMAQDSLHSGERAEADRFAAAADSLLHVAEHQRDLWSTSHAPGPPPPAHIQDLLRHVYFRTQQADYFLAQTHDTSAASLPNWAREFYQLALRAYDRKEWLAADVNARCADDVLTALESLAQAASMPPPPPAPPPPRPAPGAPAPPPPPARPPHP